MVATIQDMLHREPFQPFRIVLTSGDRYEVTNPDMLMVGQTQIFYLFPRSDRLTHLRMNQIAAIETLNGDD